MKRYIILVLSIISLFSVEFNFTNETAESSNAEQFACVIVNFIKKETVKKKTPDFKKPHTPNKFYSQQTTSFYGYNVNSNLHIRPPPRI
ncbi:MAG: hypothetical protein IT280_04630 [Ignavibacteria bacterium]|nr:hypothetical protein [Ignavibacteria bacterium]